MKLLSQDNIFSIAVLFQIVTSIVQLTLPLIGIMNVEQAATLRVLVTFCTFIPAIIMLWLHHKMGLIVSFSIYLIIVLFNYAFFPASESFIKSTQAWTLTPIAILTALCMYYMKDYEKFWKLLLYCGRLCAILAIVYFVAFNFLPYRESSDLYNMHFGYSLLLPIMFLFTSSSMIDKFLSLLMWGIVLLVGSRGPAGMAFFFFVLFLFFFKRKSILKIAVPLLVMISLITTVLPQYYNIESSRTIGLIMRDEVTSHDSGRLNLYDLAEMKIFERPVLGWGIGSDRVLLDSYVHNFILELAIDYGVFIATFIVLFLLVSLIKGLNPARAQRIGGWVYIVMMALYGLLPLMFSNSYLIDYKFATFIGALFCTFRKDNKLHLHSSAKPLLKAYRIKRR